MVVELSSVEIVRAGFEAFNRQDFAAAAQTFAEDAIWHNPGGHRFSRDHVGIQAVGAMMAEAQSLTNWEGGYDVHDVVGNERHVVAILEAHGSRKSDGKRLDVKELAISHVRDGKVSVEAAAREYWVIVDPVSFKVELDATAELRGSLAPKGGEG